MRILEQSYATVLFSLIVLLCASFISCSDSNPEGKGQQIVRAQYTADGTIISINQPSSTVEIAHEEIKGLMPAMTMPFRVKDPAILNGLQPGDRVRFVLDVNAGIELVTEIKKAPG